MHIWLIHVDERGTEKTHKMDTEQSALGYVGNIIIGQSKDTDVKHIYCADVEQGVMKELTPILDEQKRFAFSEK